MTLTAVGIVFHRVESDKVVYRQLVKNHVVEY